MSNAIQALGANVFGSTFVPTPVVQWKNIDITVTPEFLDELAEFYSNRCVMEPSVGRHFTEERQQQMKRWLYTAYWIRASFVTGDKYLCGDSYRNQPRLSLRTTTGVAQLLSYIGAAQDTRCNITFTPKFVPVDPSLLMTYSEYHAFTNFISTYHRVVVLAEITKKPEGVLDYMSMIWAEECLRSYSEARDAFVFAASILKSTAEDAWYNEYCRIQYSDSDTIKNRLTWDILNRVFYGSGDQPGVPHE